MKSAPGDVPVEVVPIDDFGRTVELRHRPNLSGLGALFCFTMRKHTRGWRLPLLGVLFALPAVVAVCARLAQPPAPVDLLEFLLVFTVFPHVLVPLTALLYASGIVRDEVEEQTLTYLLVRPLPRRAIYVTKLLATLLVAVIFVGLFTLVTYLAIFLGAPGVTAHFLMERVMKLIGLFSLSLTVYYCIFGYMSVFATRALVAGIAYIILLEDLLVEQDFAVRYLTVVYYFRTLSARWLGINYAGWNLNVGDSPSAGACVLVLGIASLVATVLAASDFARREFRMKTPEGS
jgi:ABC-2 type transport system permease protein